MTLPHSALQRFASLLALWALLLPALLPLLHAPAALAGTGLQGAAPLCHVALHTNTHQQSPDPHKAQPSCPICQGLGSMAHAYLPSVPPQPVLFTTTAPAAIVATERLTLFTPHTAAWPRAPPSSALSL